jgi:AraC family transcriptional activator of pobA
MTKPIRVRTITEGHRLLGLPKPAHPLISVVAYTALHPPSEEIATQGVVFDFYYISLKRGFSNKFYYGQQQYDFDEGLLYFVAPNQVVRGAGPSPEDDLSGWVLLVHPDLFWGTPLAKSIKKYEYFSYSVSEALFLSAKEETVLNRIVENIEREYHANLDKFSESILLSHFETLLNYAERFYQRQFITRKKSSHQLIDRLDKLLAAYFRGDTLATQGLPSVQDISAQLHISPNYLRGLLKTLTGQSTQQYLHEKLLDKAKEQLSTTDLSVSEIAYALGFEHPQSFSKLFKAKTHVSPLEFRQSFT